MPKIIISRPINGIPINGKEYLLGATSDMAMEFPNESAARNFLVSAGLNPEGYNFETVEN